MSASPSTTECHEILDRFDSYLDSTLDETTSARFSEHLESCEACRAELALAQRMREAFDEMVMEQCPDDVFQKAIAATEASQNGRTTHAVVNPLRQPRIRRWRPLAIAATVLLLLWLGSLTFLLNPSDDFSAEEIAQARQEVELALRLVSDAGRETGVFLQNDVLNEEVVKPIQQSFGQTQ